MKGLRIILASVTGTAVMSLFSYFVSERRKKLYKEPVVLGELVRNTRVLKSVTRSTAYRMGWVLHYLAGVSFSIVYDQVWRKTKLRPSIADGILFGGINGVVGILIWKASIDNNPSPPKMDYKGYYSHLLAAHVVFGAFTAVGYLIPSLFEKKKPLVLEVHRTSPRAGDRPGENNEFGLQKQSQRVKLEPH